MRIIKPYAKMIAPPFVSDFGRTFQDGLGYADFTVSDGVSMIMRIEWAARISHRSEDSGTQETWDRFLRTHVIQHGDWSVVEHSTVSVDMYVDRGITHELVRHRLFGFTQESTRFVNYEKKMPPAFIYPQVDVECEACLGGDSEFVYGRDSKGDMVYEHAIQGGTEHGGTQYRCAYDGEWMHGIYAAEDAYKKLLAKKWRPQEARSVFPNALASRIVITGNLRNWRHFLLMRTSKEAHPQMRQVTIPLLAEFKQKIPILYEDIEPNARQIDNMGKAR
jgi:thymidylate synthase (FAD)